MAVVECSGCGHWHGVKPCSNCNCGHLFTGGGQPRLALAKKAKLNDLRRRCAGVLFDRGHIECVHEDGCPEDDTCECPLMPLVHAVLNDDDMVDVAAAEKALEWSTKHSDACTAADCVCTPLDEKGTT